MSRHMNVTLLLTIFMIFLSIQSVYSKVTSTDIPIRHVIVVMQEDRTFDHYFGTYPGANGIPEDFKMPINPFDPNSSYVSPFKLNVTRTPPLVKGVSVARVAYNNGSMNGFIYAQNQVGANGTLTMGYYDYTTIPMYWNLAREYVLCDSWFASSLGASLPNHLYLYAAQTGGYTSIPEEGLNLFTIFDLLESNGVSWKVYVAKYDPNINYTNPEAQLQMIPKGAQLLWTPLLAIPRFVHNSTLNSKIADISQYYVDLKGDDFPQVVFITPSGLSEHAPTDIHLGQFFVLDLINALMRSKYWYSSVLILVWDEWGGWFDHVPPPQVYEDGLGFRVPAIIISPYAKRGYIDSTVYDHTSILKFIEWLFDLPPLTERDSKANNILNAFDFSQPPRPPRIISLSYKSADEQAKEPSHSEIVFASYVVTFLMVMIIPLIKRSEGYLSDVEKNLRNNDRCINFNIYFNALPKGLWA
ncbi:MAG: alkaline phosphatase family protein [Candidatus Bathyarchaeia archaeon]